MHFEGAFLSNADTDTLALPHWFPALPSHHQKEQKISGQAAQRPANVENHVTAPVDVVSPADQSRLAWLLRLFYCCRSRQTGSGSLCCFSSFSSDRGRIGARQDQSHALSAPCPSPSSQFAQWSCQLHWEASRGSSPSPQPSSQTFLPNPDFNASEAG